MLANDLSAIHTCISDYFDALYTGDTALLMGKVFHPNAHLYAADMNGAFVDWPMDEFKAIIDGRQSPQANGADRDERIVMIDEAGPDTVMVKVEVLVGTPGICRLPIAFEARRYVAHHFQDLRDGERSCAAKSRRRIK